MTDAPPTPVDLAPPVEDLAPADAEWAARFSASIARRLKAAGFDLARLGTANEVLAAIVEVDRRRRRRTR